MTNFNDLSESEKYVFAKRFLSQYKLIRKIKPDVPEERDILVLLADKFYNGDTKVVADCIRFMYSKSKFDSLEQANIDDAEQEYLKSLSVQEAEAKKLAEGNKAEQEKLDKQNQDAIEQRNKARNKLIELERQEKTRSVVKTGIILCAIVAGCFAIASFGGIVGTINALLATLTELSFTQIAVLALLGYWGFGEGGFKNIFGKFKDKSKARADKREKKLADQKAKLEEQDKAQKGVAEKLSALKAQEKSAQEEAVSKLNMAKSERVKLATFDELCEGEKQLHLNEILLKSQYNKTKEGVLSTEDVKKLDKWYNHYLGCMYYGAYNKSLQTKRDFKNILDQAKTKFERIGNPLYVDNEFNKNSIKASADTKTNIPLEDLYEAI